MNSRSNSRRCARHYGMVGGLCALIVFGGWDAAGAPPVDAPPAPVRLAVLAEDVTPESRILANLLTVELAFPDVVDSFASSATKTQLQSGATLYQVEGSLNGAAGRFEWIVDSGNVTHRLFVPSGTINGVPIKP